MSDEGPDIDKPGRISETASARSGVRTTNESPERLPPGASSEATRTYLLLPLVTGTVLALQRDGASGKALAIVVVNLVLGIVLWLCSLALLIKGTSLTLDYVTRRRGWGPVLSVLFATTMQFTIMWCSVYWLISARQSSAFNEPLSKIDALYYTVTIVTTTGFGDILPRSPLARGLSTVQMGMGFTLIAITLATVISRYSSPD